MKYRVTQLASLALALALAAAGLVSGCCQGDDDDGDGMSTVRGTLALDAGGLRTILEVTSDSGDKERFDVAEGGGFELALRDDASYYVYVETGESRLPLAMRVVGDRYETTLRVDKGGAEVDIGLVRLLKPQRATPSGGEPSATIACAEGDAAGVPCPVGDAVVTCEGEGHGDDDDHHDGKHMSDGDAEWTSAIVDPTVARWVPELNAPMELGCGGNDHDDDDDDDEDDD
jgi:hypothetical protein